MDTTKAAEFLELALQALRDLEEAIPTGEQRTISLKTEVIRQALFSVMEIVMAERGT